MLFFRSAGIQITGWTKVCISNEQMVLIKPSACLLFIQLPTVLQLLMEPLKEGQTGRHSQHLRTEGEVMNEPECSDDGLWAGQ